jgi:ring-1,2-phenylacetyl-CoA epoxidase subunit PaaD
VVTDVCVDAAATVREIWALLATVQDPEIPVLSVVDLGIARDVRIRDGRVVVVITPTYSGCPAMDTIERDIRVTLAEHGVEDFDVETRLAPPWTTDWLTDEARAKLHAYGIAPPEHATSDKRALLGDAAAPACPRCGSHGTERISEFGSTACKALYRCLDCREPFDYFKCV